MVSKHPIGCGEKRIHRDAHGKIFKNSGTNTPIKDLKLKGSPLVIKGGTKIKNIRLVDGQSMLLK